MKNPTVAMRLPLVVVIPLAIARVLLMTMSPLVPMKPLVTIVPLKAMRSHLLNMKNAPVTMGSLVTVKNLTII